MNALTKALWSDGSGGGDGCDGRDGNGEEKYKKDEKVRVWEVGLCMWVVLSYFANLWQKLMKYFRAAERFSLMRGMVERK